MSLDDFGTSFDWNFSYSKIPCPTHTHLTQDGIESAR